MIDIPITGLLLGVSHALMAMGLTLQYGVARIMNLANGEMLVAGAFGAFWFFSGRQLSPYLALGARPTWCSSRGCCCALRVCWDGGHERGPEHAGAAMNTTGRERWTLALAALAFVALAFVPRLGSPQPGDNGDLGRDVQRAGHLMGAVLRPHPLHLAGHRRLLRPGRLCRGLGHRGPP